MIELPYGWQLSPLGQLRRHPDGGVFSARVDRGKEEAHAIWSETMFDLRPSRTDAVWVDEGAVLVEAWGYGAPVCNRIIVSSWPEAMVIAERDVDVVIGNGSLDGVVISPGERFVCAFYSSGQGDNGFEVYEIEELRPLGVAEPLTLLAAFQPPVFSIDARFVSAVAWDGSVFWDDALDDYDPDAVPIATLVTHDLRSKGRLESELVTSVPRGWWPAHPENESSWHFKLSNPYHDGAGQLRIPMPTGMVTVPIPPPPTTRVPFELLRAL